MTEGHNRRGSVIRMATAALILAGIGGAVAALAGPSPSWLIRIGGAVAGAVVGVIATSLWDRAQQRKEAHAAALRARDDVLGALVSDPTSEGSIFDALRATSSKAPEFRGRRDDLAWLERWWDDPEQLVVVVTGPAGTGKTRLVTEFAARRPAPWVTGWLNDGHGSDAVKAIRECGDPALILVDDADQWPDLSPLMASMAAGRGTQPTVRVILTSRSPGIARRLARKLDDRSRGILDRVPELPLGPKGGADDRARWYGEAIKAYAKARHVPPPDLPARLSSSITNPAEPILSLHAQALLAVLNSERSRPMKPGRDVLLSDPDDKTKPFEQVADALFVYEQHRWWALAERPEFGVTNVPDDVQSQTVAVLLAASPADEKQAVAALRFVPGLAKADRVNIVRWAAHLYAKDPPWPIRIKPDMLAEWFVVTQLAQIPELARLPQLMTSTQQAALLVLLAHASDHVPQAVQLFANIVASDTAGLAQAGVAAALTASVGRPLLDGELAGLILNAAWPTGPLGQVEDQLTWRLPRTRAAAAEARVTIARADGDDDAVARALLNLGSRLAGLGRYQEALAPTEEAVGLYRQLTADNPAHQPGLADALGNLGSRLAGLGRYQEALAPTEEAVGLYRQLTADNPAHQPGLAEALVSLGRRLIGLDRRPEALAPTEEAVGLYRQLTADNPAHQPGLAGALNNLGQLQNALAFNEEAVDLVRDAFADNPVYQPDMATALENLGIRLAGLGRDQEALAATDEAVRLWRRLAAADPTHQDGLAKALGNLGNRFDQLGRYQEALAAAKESVGLYRQIATDDPTQQFCLATALSNLGLHLAKMHRSQEALSAAQEAVDAYRQAAADNPAHQVGLAVALGNLGHRLTDSGRRQEALEPAEEAVRLWRQLDLSHPGQYQEIYNRELGKLLRKVSLGGQATASIRRPLGDNPAPDEPHHIPPASQLQGP
jgi:tetratricopeptide (TPR) repeat protein